MRFANSTHHGAGSSRRRARDTASLLGTRAHLPPRANDTRVTTDGTAASATLCPCPKSREAVVISAPGPSLRFLLRHLPCAPVAAISIYLSCGMLHDPSARPSPSVTSSPRGSHVSVCLAGLHQPSTRGRRWRLVGRPDGVLIRICRAGHGRRRRRRRRSSWRGAVTDDGWPRAPLLVAATLLDVAALLLLLPSSSSVLSCADQSSLLLLPRPRRRSPRCTERSPPPRPHPNWR